MSPTIGNRNRGRLLLVAALVALGVVATASQALGSFDAPVNFPVGAGPESVAVGDLNDDGNLDLATANTTASNVSILLGDGAGSFSEAPGSPVSAGGNPRSVAIGNLDSDTKPDLAVTNPFSNTVSILLGNGDGTFGAANPLSTGGTGPRTVAIGNFDAGSSADLAITNLSSLNVSVLLGNGAGSFSAAPGSPIPVTSSPFGIATGNLNGGSTDLVIGSQATSIYVLLGNGNGTFTAALNSPIVVGAEPSTPGPEAAPQSVAIGNLDGDGFADIAVANRDDNSVSVLLGNGNGTFGPKTQFDVGTKPQSVAIGNLNGGTIPDLAVANADPVLNGTDSISVLLGIGDGTFGAATNFPFAASSTDPLSVAIANLNADSLPDIVTTNSEVPGVSVFFGTTATTATVTPGRLDFESRELATTSAAQTVTFTNTSDVDQVEVSAATITDQDAADFAISSETCSAGPLMPTETCVLNVTFTPTAVDQRFSNLDISFNGAASPFTVDLAGVGAEPPVCPEFTSGTPPNCEPVPCAPGFSGNEPDCTELKARIGNVKVSGPAKVKKGKKVTYKVAITNSGNAEATGVRLKAGGRGVSFNTSVGTIAAGQTKTVKIKIKPKKTGKVKATFKVTSSNAGSKSAKKTVQVR